MDVMEADVAFAIVPADQTVHNAHELPRFQVSDVDLRRAVSAVNPHCAVRASVGVSGPDPEGEAIEVVKP